MRTGAGSLAVRSIESFPMKYKNAEYRASLARAQRAALKLARLACYEHVDDPALLPPPLREGLNIPTRKLVLLPSAGDIPHGVTAAVAETRTDLLIVRAGTTMDGSATFYFTLLRCAGGTVFLHGPLRLWASRERELYLAPDPYGDDPQGQCFTLVLGMQPAERPWTTPLEQGFGLGHGDALLLAD